MGADLIVHRACEAKETFGGGDPEAGTLRILDMLKSRSRAMAVAAHIQREGRALDGATVTVVVRTPEGEEQRQVSVADLMAEAAPLEEHEAACATCPANVTNQPYGCYGYVSYPIPASAEGWLIDRLQTAEALGGKLVLDAIRDFDYDGAPMRRFRELGILEAPAPARKTVKKGWLFGGTQVSSDQLLQAILAVGGSLDPMHCALVLLWYGALEVDGSVPDTVDVRPLQALVEMHDVPDRERRTRLVTGESSADDGVAAMQHMLAALYGAFVNGVPLVVDA